MKKKVFDEVGFKAAHAELYKFWLRDAPPPPQNEEWYRAWKLVIVQYMNKEVGMYPRVAGIRADGDFLVIRQGAFPDETFTRINLKTVQSYSVEIDE